MVERNQAKKVSEGIQRGARDMQEKANDMLEMAKVKLNHARMMLDENIRKKPEQSILIAAGIGVVVGAIVACMFLKHNTTK